MKDKITIQTGAQPSKEEIMTANFLASEGKIIRFLAPNQIKGIRTPDIEMDKLRWEIKCPVGKSPNTIKRAFKVALNQSRNMIFDLRHSKMPDEFNVAKLKKEFSDIKSAHRLIIITKSKKILDISK